MNKASLKLPGLGIEPMTPAEPAADYRPHLVAIGGTGGESYSIEVYAVDIYDAVRQAAEFFNDTVWRGPKSMPDTVLEVSARGRKTFVRVGDATPK